MGTAALKPAPVRQPREYPWVHKFKDRHGKWRRYFRRPNHKRVALPGRPGSPEYERAYQDALAGKVKDKKEVGASLNRRGTLRAATLGLFESSAFKAHAPNTQRGRRSLLETFCERTDDRGNTFGDKQVAGIRWRHVDKWIGDLRDRPAAARHLLFALRDLFQYCIKDELRTDDPTEGVTLPPKKKGGYHTWTEDDIARFEAAYPVGSRERLAEGLALYTLQRCETVARLGPQHVLMQRLLARPTKTEYSTGFELSVRLHRELVRLIEKTPTGTVTFLTRVGGTSYTPAHLSEWFSDACSQIGLHKCTMHGLRKAGCRRLVEKGASLKMIAGLTGHKSLRALEVYLQDADKEIMADAAMDIMEREYPGGSKVNRSRSKTEQGRGKPPKKFAKHNH